MIFFNAYVFGFALAISFGPIALIIFNNAISFGLASSMKIALGAALADGFIGLIVFIIGGGLLIYLTPYVYEINVVSGLVLISLGVYFIVSSEQKNFKHDRGIKAKEVFVLTIINPTTIVLFLSFLGTINNKLSIIESTLLAFSLFLGSLSSQLIYSFIGCLAKDALLNINAIKLVKKLSGLSIISFGVISILP